MTHKLLLVEDNEDARVLLAEVIEGAGFEVSAAGSVDEAATLAAQGAFEVLVSDISLPDGTGVELMRRLQDAGSPIYGIAMSGFGSNTDVAASLAAGFRHHLVKPFELKLLEAHLQTAKEALAAAPGSSR